MLHTILMEGGLPKLVRQLRYRLWVLSLDGVRRQQSPPKHGRYAQISESVRDETDGVDVLRDLVPGQDHGMVIHDQQAFHNAKLPHLPDLRPIEIDPIRLARLAFHLSGMSMLGVASKLPKDGSITGDLSCARISIEDGAHFKGRIEIDPAKSKVAAD